MYILYIGHPYSNTFLGSDIQSRFTGTCIHYGAAQK
jgi:hypothetical protein